MLRVAEICAENICGEVALTSKPRSLHYEPAEGAGSPVGMTTFCWLCLICGKTLA
jgi:hypothetical protein